MTLQLARPNSVTVSFAQLSGAVMRDLLESHFEMISIASNRKVELHDFIRVSVEIIETHKLIRLSHTLNLSDLYQDKALKISNQINSVSSRLKCFCIGKEDRNGAEKSIRFERIIEMNLADLIKSQDLCDEIGGFQCEIIELMSNVNRVSV